MFDPFGGSTSRQHEENADLVGKKNLRFPTKRGCREPLHNPYRPYTSLKTRRDHMKEIQGPRGGGARGDD